MEKGHGTEGSRRIPGQRGEGNYAECVRLLRTVRNYAHRFGGSHAQRDVLDLTLIEAARRAGQENLAAALLAERAGKLGSGPTERFTPIPTFPHQGGRGV